MQPLKLQRYGVANAPQYRGGLKGVPPRFSRAGYPSSYRRGLAKGLSYVVLPASMQELHSDSSEAEQNCICGEVPL